MPAAAIALFLALAPLAQVTVEGGAQRIDGRAEDVEVESPMALTLDLPASLGQPLDVERAVRWSAPDVSRYVCDKARVTGASLIRSRKWKRGDEYLVARLGVESGWFSQDVHLRAELVHAGRTVAEAVKRGLTIGNAEHGQIWGAGLPRTVDLEMRIDAETIAETIGSGEAQLRVTLEIDD